MYSMESHKKKNLDLLDSACATLGELARDMSGRKTAENVAKILEGVGVRAVVRAVETNISGGDKRHQHAFLCSVLCSACSALDMFMLDLRARRSAAVVDVVS